MQSRLVMMALGLLACAALPAAPNPPGSEAAASEEAGTPVPAAAGEVVRTVFTSGVSEREPVDSILTLGSGESHVYCFTELRGFAGQHVTHRWEYDGQVMAEVGFDVGGWRWRVWSRKNLQPEWRGTWRVSVLDQEGRVVMTRELTYDPAQAFTPPRSTVTAANQ